jgi:GxxExxY protein
MEYLYQDLTGSIIKCAIKVHSSLGPGLLESAYEECLAYELDTAGLHYERQKPMPLVYHEVKLDIGYRIDLLAENKVVIEIKSVEALNPLYMAHIMTYLKLSECRIGLLIQYRFLEGWYKTNNTLGIQPQSTLLINAKTVCLCIPSA